MRYEITSPEGQRFEVTAPDGASQDQVLTYARSQFAKSKPQVQVAPQADITGVETPAEAIAGNPVTRFALGAASPLLGAAQLQTNMNPLARMLGADVAVNDWLARLEAMKRAGMKGAGTEGFDVSGTLGAALNPAGLGVARAVPAAAGMLGRVEQGAGFGAGMGVTTPVTEGGDNFTLAKLLQTALGTGAGAASAPIASGIGSAVTKASNLIEPFLPGGAQRMGARTANAAAGARHPQVVAALQNPATPVAGAPASAGEAAAPAGSAEFAALQKIVESRRPSDYDAMARAADAARVAQVRTVGGDDVALALAEAERKTAADPLYAAARAGTTPINTGQIVQQVDDLLAKNPGNRELVAELSNIKSGLLDAKGQPRTSAQEVSSVLDGMKAAIAKKENAFIKGTLTGIKDKLASAIPGYEQAQKVFAEKSVPVNQMQTGQYLEGKLVPALADFDGAPAQKAATYAGALRDAPGTVKRATGDPRYERLSQYMNPQQVDALDGVAESLARKARYEQLAREGSKEARRLLGEEFPKAGMQGYLERTVTIMRAVVNRLEGRATEKTLDYLADKMRDPAEMARIMQAATPSQRRYLMDAITAQAAGSTAARSKDEQ